MNTKQHLLATLLFCAFSLAQAEENKPAEAATTTDKTEEVAKPALEEMQKKLKKTQLSQVAPENLLTADPADKNPVLLEKEGVTMRVSDILAITSDLSRSEIIEISKNPSLLILMIEEAFDNKVIYEKLTKAALKDNATYQTISAMNESKYANRYYYRQEAIKKINEIKDISNVAKQRYLGQIKEYQRPATADYYHILFVTAADDKEAVKTKAEGVLKAIKDKKISMAEAAVKYRTIVSGTNAEGILKDVGPNQLFGPLEKVAADLQVGGVSDLVESEAGYHIISLIEKHPAKTIPYDDDIKEQNINLIQNEIFQEAYSNIRKPYVGPANLKVNDTLFKKTIDDIVSNSKKRIGE